MDLEKGLLVLAIIGTVSVLKETSTKISGWITILIAITIGVLAGLGGVEGLNIVTGILSALAALGTVAVVDRIKG